MNIVIFGAGTVGSWLAKLLCEKSGWSQESHNVTVVDKDAGHLHRLNEELDLRIVVGNAAEAATLFQAGVTGCDLALAMTGLDEVNLVAASLAKAMGAHRTVARVYAPVFRDLSTFDYQRHFQIDRMISLEHLSAVELAQRIRQPDSVVVENFAQGDIQVQEATVSEHSPVLGQSVKTLKLPKGLIIGSIRRSGRVRIAGADDTLEDGDQITLIGTHKQIESVFFRFEKGSPSRKKVVIVGGGETGYYLASLLEGGHYSVAIMEADKERCHRLAARLKHTTIVHSDATIQKNLEEERVGNADVFAACTGDDENNIMACVEARELGVPTVMAIVGRPDYANVLGKLGISHAVSPRQVVAKQVVSFLTSGPLLYRRRLLQDEDLGAEAGGVTVLEVEVLAGTPAIEKPLASLNLPRECRIACVTRNESTRVPTGEDRLQAGDMVVILAADHAVDATLQRFSLGGLRS